MDQLKDTTVRFGVTALVDFRANGGWKSIDVVFAAPFGPPKPGSPKGVPQRISVVATPLHMRVAPVVVVKNVTATGFTLLARNAMNKDGEAAFSWLAVLGVPESRALRNYDVRLGVLQTKILTPPHITSWPGIWFSQPLVGNGGAPAILLTGHNMAGPSRDDQPWRNAASVASVYPLAGSPTPIPPDDGFSVGALNVESAGRSGFYYAAFIQVGSVGNVSPDVGNLWLDHGSEHGVEDAFQYNGVAWPTPPNRTLQPGAEPGDWVHLDVYFDRPFLTPPVVLATARDADPNPQRHHNPLATIAQNVTTHGFTLSARNTDTVVAMAEFYWIAIGCASGCG